MCLFVIRSHYNLFYGVFLDIDGQGVVVEQ